MTRAKLQELQDYASQKKVCPWVALDRSELGELLNMIEQQHEALKSVPGVASCPCNSCTKVRAALQLITEDTQRVSGPAAGEQG